MAELSQTMLALLQSKLTATKAANESLSGRERTDALAQIEKIYKKGVFQAKKAQRVREPKAPSTDKQKKQASLNLKDLTYEPVLEFEGYEDARAALHEFASNKIEGFEWYTSMSGLHGSTQFRSLHGGSHGCWLITAHSRTAPFGVATLHQAVLNNTALPEASDQCWHLWIVEDVV